LTACYSVREATCVRVLALYALPRGCGHGRRACCVLLQVGEKICTAW
jgi:hypothetical protein